MALTADSPDLARDQSSQPLRELRELIWSVHPENDNLPSLADFIASFSARFVSTAGLELELDFPASLPEMPLPGQYRQEVAALVKESLRNIVQHAQARRVTIRLRVEQGGLHLSVRDDGKGFSPGHGPGHGLSNLQARSHALNGTCRVISSPGRGAEMQFSLPLPR